LVCNSEQEAQALTGSDSLASFSSSARDYKERKKEREEERDEMSEEKRKEQQHKKILRRKSNTKRESDTHHSRNIRGENESRARRRQRNRRSGAVFVLDTGRRRSAMGFDQTTKFFIFLHQLRVRERRRSRSRSGRRRRQRKSVVDHHGFELFVLILQIQNHFTTSREGATGRDEKRERKVSKADQGEEQKQEQATYTAAGNMRRMAGGKILATSESRSP
jgi:hypothetical protein